MALFLVLSFQNWEDPPSWEKFPNNPVFFFLREYLIFMIIVITSMSVLYWREYEGVVGGAHGGWGGTRGVAGGWLGGWHHQGGLLGGG